MEKEQIAQLVESVRQGDNKAFEKLYNETNKGAYFVALKITGNEEDALDILQDSYIKALDKLEQLKDSGNFVSWFNQIVANTAKNYLCKKKPVLFNTEEDEQASQDWQVEEDSEFIPEESLDTNESRKAIMDIIDALPEDRRLCVLMYYFDDMGTSQIAKTLEIPEGTVKSHLLHARKSIKKTIEELRRMGKTVLGTSAIPFFSWLLKRMSSTVVMSQEQAGSLLAVIKGASLLLGGAAAVATTSAAVIGGTAVKIGIVGKIVAAVTVPKIVAAAVGAAVIVGGATVGITIAKKNNEPSETASSGTYYEYNNDTYSFEDAGIVFDDENETDEPLLNENITAAVAGNSEKTASGSPVSGTDGSGGSLPVPIVNNSAAGTSSTNHKTNSKTTVKSSTVRQSEAGSTGKTTSTQKNTEKSSSTTAKKSETTKKTSTKTTKAETTAKIATTTKKAVTTTKKTTTTRKATTTKKVTTTRKATTTTKKVTTTQKATTTTTKPTTTQPTTTKPTTTQAIEFDYTVSGSSATITGYKGSGGNVSIPSEIDGASVTAIGDYAFENESGITSVSVPSSVRSIGKGAFANCTSLTRVSLPSGLTSLGNTVFKGCDNLTSINIPSSLSSIPAGAFQGCSALTSVTIPSSVTSIGTNAFDSCPNLTIKCTAGSAAETYAKENGINYTV